MDINIFTIIQSLFSAFAHSAFFGFIKILAGVHHCHSSHRRYSALSKRLRGDWKTAFYGAKVPSLKKSKYTEKWEEIKKNAESGDMSKAKIAMIEADQMFGETLEKIGYKGQDTAEKIGTSETGTADRA